MYYYTFHAGEMPKFLIKKEKIIQIKSDLEDEHPEFVWKRTKSYEQNPA